MYLGTFIEPRWPIRATPADYARYARLEYWHIEEAATLVLRLVPRTNRVPFPVEPGDPSPLPPVPYSGAVPWHILFRPNNGAIARIISLYARSVGWVGPWWQLPAEKWSVQPRAFIAFCMQHGIEVPEELERATRGDSPAAVEPQHEKVYRVCALAMQEVVYKLRAQDQPVRPAEFQQMVVERMQAKGIAEQPDDKTFRKYRKRLAAENSKFRAVLPRVVAFGPGRSNKSESHPKSKPSQRARASQPKED